jgi:hypothetical protein
MKITVLRDVEFGRYLPTFRKNAIQGKGVSQVRRMAEIWREITGTWAPVGRDIHVHPVA